MLEQLQFDSRLDAFLTLAVSYQVPVNSRAQELVYTSSLNLPFSRQPMNNELVLRGKEALVRSLIWSFVGVLYGILFIYFFSLASEYALDNALALAAACVLASAVAALIYSSMRLAVIVAPFASIVSILFVIINGDDSSLGLMLMLVLAVGTVTGAVYGAMVKQSNVYRADAKTLAGISAGVLVAVLGSLLILGFPDFPLGLVVALMCLLTGSIYVTIVPGFITRFNKLLPPIGDGALVGAGTSVFVGLFLFVMVTTVTPETAGDLRELMESIRENLLQAILGGMLGGAVAGFFSGMMLRQWQDL